MRVPELALRALGTETTADACDRRAELRPDHEAVADSMRRLSWAQLRQQSDGVALGLLRLGAERGDVALVQLPNNVDLFVARVACEKAGLVLAAVPLTFREAELSALIDQLRPAVAITAGVWQGHDYAQTLACAAGTFRLAVTVRADGEGGAPALAELAQAGDGGESALLERTRLSLFERSQIATTSGSTGTPKCAEVPAYARALTGWCQAGRYQVRPGDTLCALTAIVAGTAEALVYHMTPRLGCRALLVERFEPAAACETLERERVAGVTVVPTMLARLAALPPPTGGFESLRFFASHGARLAEEHASAIEQRFGARIVQAFGASDYGGIAASGIEDPAEDRWNTAGRPLEGVEIRLLDELGRQVPAGRAGRLFVRGPQALGGYYRRAALTREAWRTGWFDVGEFAHLDGRGNVVLDGRARELIIRGGQNIFPGEIERLLTQHPEVAEAAVVGVPDAEMGERVCACVVPRDGARPGLGDLADFLKSRGLAGFKLPERLEVLQRLPLVAAGQKVDKQQLLQLLQDKTSEPE
ncbi:MAG: acyl--CoA ligase [Chloroflexota bacterium]|nr:acyl--CoA ligase [Chloroflexota bacterium]